MSFLVLVSISDTPGAFLALRNAIRHLAGVYGTQNIAEIKSLLQSEMNIILHPKQYKENNVEVYYPLEFLSDKEYTAFMLKWG